MTVASRGWSVRGWCIGVEEDGAGVIGECCGMYTAKAYKKLSSMRSWMLKKAKPASEGKLVSRFPFPLYMPSSLSTLSAYAFAPSIPLLKR